MGGGPSLLLGFHVDPIGPRERTGPLPADLRPGRHPLKDKDQATPPILNRFFFFFFEFEDPVFLYGLSGRCR